MKHLFKNIERRRRKILSWQCNSLMLEEKLQVIEYARTHNKKQAALTLGVQTKQIRDWEEKEEEIPAIPQKQRMKLLTFHPGAKVCCEKPRSHCFCSNEQAFRIR